MNRASFRGKATGIVAAAGLMLLLAVPAVSAYEGEVAQTVTVTPPAGGVPCGVNTPVSATLIGKDGQPVADAPVTWSFTKVVSSQDSIVEPNTTSNAEGVATTEVWLDCIEGQRQLQAASGDAVGGAVLGVTGVPAGLPNTATSLSHGGDVTPPWTLALAGIAMLIGGIMGIRTIVART